MLYLEQQRNRMMFMAISTLTSIALSAVVIQGINAVGVLLATAIINIFVYYSMPGRYSKAYMDKYLSHINPTARR